MFQPLARIDCIKLISLINDRAFEVCNNLLPEFVTKQISTHYADTCEHCTFLFVLCYHGNQPKVCDISIAFSAHLHRTIESIDWTGTKRPSQKLCIQIWNWTSNLGYQRSWIIKLTAPSG